MRKTLFSLTLILIFATNTKAQQESIYNNFWTIQNYYLPAKTGLENELETTVLARNQWAGVNGHPKIIQAQFSKRLKALNSGIGFYYLAEKVGFATVQKAKVSYAYHLKINENQVLSFGVNLGASYHRVSGDWIPPTGVPDPSFPNDDPQYNFNSDFGINYQLKNWQIGLGVTQLVIHNPKDQFNWVPFYNLQSSYQFSFGKQLVLTPRVLIQSDLVQIVGTLNTQLRINKWLQTGFSIRTSQFYGANLTFHFLKHFFATYAFEFSPNFNSMKGFNTHEAVLGYAIPLNK